LSTAELMKISG